MPNERLSLEIVTQATGQDSVDRLTTAMNRFATASEAAANKTNTSFKGISDAADKSGASMRRLFLAVKDLGEGRRGFATVEAGYFIQSLGGVATAAGVAAVAVGALALAIYKFKDLSGEAAEKSSAAYRGISDSLRTTNDELRVSNDRLANQIAKIEKKPENNAKLALDETRLAADKLADSLDKNFGALQKVMKETEPSRFNIFRADRPGLVSGNTPLDVRESGVSGLGGFRATIAGLNGDPSKTRDALQGEVGYLQDQIKKTLDAQKRESNPTYFQGQVEKLQAYAREYAGEIERIDLTQKNTGLEGQKDNAEAGREADERAKEADRAQKVIDDKLFEQRRRARSIAQSDSDRSLTNPLSRAYANANSKLEDFGDSDQTVLSRSAHSVIKQAGISEIQQAGQEMARRGVESTNSDYAKSIEEDQKTLLRGLEEQNKQLEIQKAEYQKIQSLQNALTKQNESAATKTIGGQGNFANRLTQGSMLTEQQKIAAIYSQDLATVQRIYEVQLAAADSMMGQDEQTKARNEADLTHEEGLQKLREGNILQLMELENKQAQAFSSTLVAGFNAITQRFGRGQATRSFLEGTLRSQLDTVVGNAGTALFKSGPVQSIQKSLGINSSLLKGTIFDGGAKSIPLDANTAALRELTARLSAMTGAPSPSGGGGSTGVPGIFGGGSSSNPYIFSDLPISSNGASSLAGMSMEGGDPLDIPLSSNGASSLAGMSMANPSTLGSNVAMGVTAGMGAFVAAQDFKRGGASGALGGVGALAGAAGGIMAMAGLTGPAAPIVAGIGAALSIVGSLIGTGPQKRAQDISNTLQAAQYMGPEKLDVSQDGSGNYVDFNARGGLRTSSFRADPQVTNPYVWAQTHGFLGGPPTYYNVPGQVTSPYSPWPGGVPPTAAPVQHIYQAGAIQTMDAHSFEAFVNKPTSRASIADATATAMQSGHSRLSNQVQRAAGSRG